MADNADGFPGGIQVIECIQCDIECFLIQRAEAFIEEQGFNLCLMADEIRQGQCKRQADQERFPAGEGFGVALSVSLPGIGDLQLAILRCFALQYIAAVQFFQPPVCQMDQIIQCQPLGKAAEFGAIG